MASIDTYLHVLGGELLLILALVLPHIENRHLKQVVLRAFLLLLGCMLAHLTLHVIPHNMAGFIYSSQHEFYTHKRSGLTAEELEH